MYWEYSRVESEETVPLRTIGAEIMTLHGKKIVVVKKTAKKIEWKGNKKKQITKRGHKSILVSFEALKTEREQ